MIREALRLNDEAANPHGRFIAAMKAVQEWGELLSPHDIEIMRDLCDNSGALSRQYLQLLHLDLIAFGVPGVPLTSPLSPPRRQRESSCRPSNLPNAARTA